MDITKELFNMQDLNYKKFHSKLMPTVDENLIIGVRVPTLRNYAKLLFKTDNYVGFLDNLPHKYYEENNLHAFLLEQIKDFDTLIQKTSAFLPCIDNWATCDGFKPKAFKNHKAQLILYIEKWIKSDHVYTVRYAINQLMTYFLDDDFDKKYFDWVLTVSLDDYYIKMMKAWYFATALINHSDQVIDILSNKKLDTLTHNKTIQKAVESYRIDNKTKEYLKTLKL